jgi:alpha-beta hydrolase superfamily lysophospholipase
VEDVFGTKLRDSHKGSEIPFSFEELASARRIAKPPLQRIRASDGVELAYRAYVPRDPQGVLVLYHGGGAHSGAGYEHIAADLSADHSVAVFTPDVRGHGASGGARGDAPSTKRVLDDVDVLVDEVKKLHPAVPMFLGGHSSGAALVLQHSGAGEIRGVAGYVFISAEMGFLSRTAWKNRRPFSSAAVPAFILHRLTGGVLFGHSKAVKLNYPNEVLDSDIGLLAYYTVNMANALVPTSPARQLRRLRKPLGVWIGELDELLDAGKVERLVKRACPWAYVERITGEKHLTILLKAADHVGLWIARESDKLVAH